MGKLFTFAEANGIQTIFSGIEILGTETIVFIKDGKKIVFDSWQAKNYPETTIGLLKRYFGIWDKTKRLEGVV